MSFCFTENIYMGNNFEIVLIFLFILCIKISEIAKNQILWEITHGNIVNANLKLKRIPDNTSQIKSTYHITILMMLL